jgi:hypothetical protein
MQQIYQSALNGWEGWEYVISNKLSVVSDGKTDLKIKIQK